MQNTLSHIKKVFSGANILKYIISLAAALLVCPLASSCSSETEDTSALVKTAFDAAKKADWKKTLDLSSKALKNVPREPSAAILNALAHEAVGESDEAIRVLRANFSPETDNFMAQYTLGRLLFGAKRFEEAVVPLEKAKKLRPENMNAVLLFARTGAKLNREDAMAAYKTLIASRKFSKQATALLWNETALLFAMKGDMALAEKAFGMAVSGNPVQPDIRLNYAILLDYQPSLAKFRMEAKRHYADYLRLTEKRSDLEKERENVTARMKLL